MLLPLLASNNRLYIGTDGNGVDILNLQEAVHPNPRVDIQPPLIEGDKALLRWKAFTFWEELPIDEVRTRSRLDEGPWSNWSASRELSCAVPAAGEHR